MEPLTRPEVQAFARDWYHKLDEHVPAAEMVPLVADEVELSLPEGVLRGKNAFHEWYEGVIHIFFDEVHTLRRVDLSPVGQWTRVGVVVNWQARRWRPPAPRSEWVGFDAYQTWEMVRSPADNRPVVIRYVVDELRPMNGSPSLDTRS
jgi:hypothetical protein